MFLVEQDGNQDHVKIVDFGIALKAHGPNSQPGVTATAGQVRQSLPVITKEKENVRYTLAGMVMGTPHYMSPEQIEGGDIDARSDQYALGCILYELLTGTVPFDGADSQTILMKHLAAPVTPLRERYPQGQAPASLQAVVTRMLAKERVDRFPSLREAAEALKQEADRLLGTGGSTTILPKSKSSGLVIRGRRFSLWTVLPIATLLIGGAGYVALRQLTQHGETLKPDELRLVRQQALDIVARGLKEPSDEVRRSLVEGLGLTRDARQQPLVMPLLHDPSAAVQAQAATALGQLGDRAAAAPLLAMARQSQAANVRTAAAAAAWQLGQNQGHELLVQALDSGDAAARQKAAFLLAEQAEPKAQALLRKVLQSADLPEDAAVKLLGRLAQSGDAAARAQLRERLTDPGRPSYLLAAGRLLALGDDAALQALRARASSAVPDRLVAARLLASADPEHSLPLLREVAQNASADAPARLLAVSGLGQGGAIAEVRILRPLLEREREPELQRGAALSVLQILARDPGALSEQGLLWARAALSDSDWVVRESAAVVLGDLRGSEAAALLSALSSDREPRVRRSAMRSLGRRDEHAAAAPPDPVVLTALHTGLQDTDLGVRQEALRALAKVARALVQKGAPGLLTQLTGWLGGILSDGSPLEQTLARAALLAAGDTTQQAKLRELLQSSSAEVRRAALESLEPDKELLASLLQDPAAGVRFLAARRLAELGDRRAIAVLKEALAQGGAAARTAQALLIRLGEAPPPPPPIDSGSQDPVEQRLQAVDALAGLPGEQAIAQLLLAARDHDPAVRRRVATVAADLPGGGLPVLRLLLEDANPSVRALAAALLGRLQPTALPVAEPAPGAPNPANAVADLTAAAPTAKALAAADAGTSDSPEPGPGEPPADAGTDDLPAAAADPDESSIEAQAAQLTQSGVKLLQRRDFAKARQLFEKARHLCGRQKKSDLCASLQFDLSYNLAHVYEGQGYEAEAMGEYERLIKQSGRVPGKSAELQDAQAGVIRLAPRLGVVMITRSSGGKCQEVTKWMPLGTHQIDVNGEKQTFTVRPDAPARVGSCP